MALRSLVRVFLFVLFCCKCALGIEKCMNAIVHACMLVYAYVHTRAHTPTPTHRIHV